LNGSHQFLIYGDDVTILGKNTNTITKKNEALLEVSKEVGLEVNTEKIKYVYLTKPSWTVSLLKWLKETNVSGTISVTNTRDLM